MDDILRSAAKKFDESLGEYPVKECQQLTKKEFWVNTPNRVIVAGAGGFFATHIIAHLSQAGYEIVPIYHSCKNEQNLHPVYDLTQYNDALNAISRTPATHLINCAAFSGGIKFNALYPDQIFEKNTQMGINILKAASKNPHLKRIYNIISSCAYPDKELLKENEFWDGLPNETIRFFGLQKRNLVAYSESLAKTCSDKEWQNLIFNNLYGPHDSVNPTKTKVVMNLIRKFVEAKEQDLPAVKLWGSGIACRQLTYVRDAAQWIQIALETHKYPQVINMIGRQEEISILSLAEMISDIVDYRGIIRIDLSKPDGQLHKILDYTLCEKYFGSLNERSLEEGLRETIAWFRLQTISRVKEK